MARSLEELFRELSALDERDRATLAGLLLETLSDRDGSDEELELAWKEEISRRLAKVDSGKAETFPWEQVKRELFSGQ